MVLVMTVHPSCTNRGSVITASQQSYLRTYNMHAYAIRSHRELEPAGFVFCFSYSAGVRLPVITCQPHSQFALSVCVEENSILFVRSLRAYFFVVFVLAGAPTTLSVQFFFSVILLSYLFFSTDVIINQLWNNASVHCARFCNGNHRNWKNIIKTKTRITMWKNKYFHFEYKKHRHTGKRNKCSVNQTHGYNIYVCKYWKNINKNS